MKFHPSITVDRVMDLVAESTMDASMPGVCIECGEDQDGCEPDAERYYCGSCGKPSVYGAEQLMFWITGP